MLRSMTGFGSAAGVVEDVEYSVELRSVNNRYFKPIMKLPESFSAVEPQIERILRGRLHRGTINVSVQMKLPEDQAAYRVNPSALSGYLEQLRTLDVRNNPMLRVDLASLLLLPGVCEPPRIEELQRKTCDGLMTLVTDALDALEEMRRREGKAIEDDLLANCGALERAIEHVTERAPQVVRDYQDRLIARVQELTNAAELRIDAETLAREVAIFAERSDVAEELSRSTTHVEHFRHGIQDDEPSGRKLEFIAQEMFREANTIASKANDSEIVALVVEMKTAIDRIKEQVQNVE